MFSLILVLTACGGHVAADGGVDVSSDVRGDLSDAPRGCVSDNDCTDRLFCNGAERCAPGAMGADSRGCVPASPATPCTSSQTCDESQQRCVAGCVDNDHDGHGGAGCGDDCDDNDPQRFPGNAEVCDGMHHDEDCDPCTVAGPVTGDADHDGYASRGCSNAYSGPTPGCDPMHIRVDGASMYTTGSDCDDAAPDVHPNQSEACNGVDDNCNGTTDEGLRFVLYYADCDRDGTGNMTTPLTACAPPEMAPVTCPTGSWATRDDDCDDANAMRRPGATEVCNGIDDDCNGGIDEGVESSYYVDCDGDGHGSGAAVLACTTPSSPVTCGGMAGGWAGVGDDCDDTRPETAPGSPEICDGLDNDCDGVADEGLAIVDYYADCDADGYGLAGSMAVSACAVPTTPACAGNPAGRWAPNNTDCNDANGTIHPGAPELCDGVTDANCDGQIGNVGVDCAYRITSMTLISPPLRAPYLTLCLNITTDVNSTIGTAISSGDLNIVNVFRPFAPGVIASPLDVTSNASCTTSGCTPDPMTPILVHTMAGNAVSGGTCFTPNLSDVNVHPGGTPASYSPTVSTVGGPCWISNEMTLSVNFAGLVLPFQHVRISTGYPVRGGVFAGFITEADARAARFPATTPMIGGTTLYSHLQAGGASGSVTCAVANDDRDVVGGVTGFWFFFNISESNVAWSAP